jgi:hypothetical protein
MTIKVTKPEINIREKLSDLDFDKVPFQKMPAGSVLQVVQHHWGRNSRTGGDSESGEFTGSGGINTTSTAWVDTGITKSINTKGNTRILIHCTIPDVYKTEANSSTGFRFQLNGTNQYYLSSHTGYGLGGYSTTAERTAPISGSFLTEVLPEGTHTIDVQWRVVSGSAGFHNGHTASQSETSLILMEIAQ